MWHKDPENWRFGVFYVNRKDPRVFVPKRNPLLGWTLNFGNPVAWLLILALVLTIAFILKFT
ncbi:MAG: hypothetical protein GXO47_04040 [Chlorobi bacterium]|nr:hypothetical protein [Chlorobiota bacterium]